MSSLRLAKVCGLLVALTARGESSERRTPPPPPAPPTTPPRPPPPPPPIAPSLSGDPDLVNAAADTTSSRDPLDLSTGTLPPSDTTFRTQSRPCLLRSRGAGRSAFGAPRGACPPASTLSSSRASRPPVLDRRYPRRPRLSPRTSGASPRRGAGARRRGLSHRARRRVAQLPVTNLVGLTTSSISSASAAPAVVHPPAGARPRREVAIKILQDPTSVAPRLRSRRRILLGLLGDSEGFVSGSSRSARPDRRALVVMPFVAAARSREIPPAPRPGDGGCASIVRAIVGAMAARPRRGDSSTAT